ncbi:MAG: CHASE3 domain-containing protein [Sphingosinicella sp.]|uniref:CHASE3 domain-containing protein n=1 Tax=Sphingosinicella sp. TaxID=1917971 RepID=UPI0040383AA8
MPINSSSPVQQTLIFWAAIILISAASLLSLLSTQRLVTLASRVEQSQNVLVELNRSVSHLKDVETGLRGYIITSDSRYLQSYNAGRDNFGSSVRRLRELAQNDPVLQLRVHELEALGQQRIRIAGQAVASRTEDAPPRAALPFITAGKATMDQIRRQADSIISAEQSVYRARERAVARQAQITNIILVVGVALSLAAMIWLFTIRGREVERRRRAEDELRALNAELEDRVQERTSEVRRSRELLDAVIENMPDALILQDADDDFRYVLVNRAGERLMGKERGEIVGRVDQELFPPDQAAAFLEEDRAVVATGQPRFCAERPISTANGIRLIDTSKVPIPSGNGGRGFVLGIVRDVTEQKALEAQLRQSQRMHAVGRLTGGIAHDFNNILAIILGNADLLREQLAEGTESAEMAEEVLGAAAHGAELVRRLLAFSRMQHLEPTALDLNERLPAIIGLLKRTLGEAINIQTKPVEGLWPAMVDPTQVDDALVNLAINARDAMPEGGSLTIETGNEVLDEDYAAQNAEVAPGDYVMLAVSDTGTGMAPAVITRAFEPFFTTKAEGKGSGLGLSQVYGWVKQSGGHIKIYSELGHGTTIKLFLPRASATADEVRDEADRDAIAIRGHETILVVEDNPNVLRTVVRQLGDLGYASIEATNGAEALDLIRSGVGFDLLLTDIVMPGGITGYELAARVREIQPAVKVLFTSGYTELAATGGDANRGPLLSKPYRKQDLGRAIRAVVDNGH